MQNFEIFQKAAELLANRQPAWMVTVTNVAGSSPGKIGNKMLVSAAEQFGTIGGGTIEISVVKKILVERPRIAECWTFDLGCENVAISGTLGNEKVIHKTGMVCGGMQQVLVEPLFCAHELYIVGGGHCGRALSELAAKCGFVVTVIDERPEQLEKNQHPWASKLICASYEEVAQHINFDPSNTFVVIMTHAHNKDELALRRVLEAASENNLRYVGVIGSQKKARTILDRLLSDGFSADILAQIYMPIGLAIESETPYEIAVSIVAQLIAVKNKAAI